jgi:uncharacterized protein (TIGR02453 family)
MTTIAPTTFDFLRRLKKNNNREWFTAHKIEFQAVREEVISFFHTLTDRLKVHDDIEKMKFFRIYRDVRFSKDKTPYKTHLAGHFVRATKRLRGGYYLHLKPGESFLAGGFWDPNKEDLLRIRKEFEMDSTEIRAIVGTPEFKQHFGELKGDRLKTAPPGFDKEDPNLDLIQMKQFIVTREFSDAEVLSADFLNEVDSSFRAMRPYFDYMSDVLTTDLNGVSLLDD